MKIGFGCLSLFMLKKQCCILLITIYLVCIKINTLYVWWCPLSLHKGDPFALFGLSLLASAAVVNYSKWNKNGTCLLADKSLTCPACGVTRVAWSTTKIQLTSGTASLHRHRTAIWGCAVDCCCAMSSRKDIWDLAKQHMAGVYDYNFSWPTKISFLSSVHYTPFTNFNTWIH